MTTKEFKVFSVRIRRDGAVSGMVALRRPLATYTYYCYLTDESLLKAVSEALCDDLPVTLGFSETIWQAALDGYFLSDVTMVKAK